jgi:hypothetical protein
MNKIKIILTAVLTVSLLTGCATTQQNSKPISQSKSAQSVLASAKSASFFASLAVLKLAVNDSDRVKKAEYIYGIARGVRTLAGGTVPTAQELKDTISLWSPDKVHWANLADGISDIYSLAFDEYVKGDAKYAFQLLEQIALGLEKAAGSVAGVKK